MSSAFPDPLSVFTIRLMPGLVNTRADFPTRTPEPDATARELLDRLICRHPERFSGSHLRTLQRRVRQWRRVMARELVYASGERSEMIEADQRNIRPVGVD